MNPVEEVVWVGVRLRPHHERLFFSFWTIPYRELYKDKGTAYGKGEIRTLRLVHDSIYFMTCAFDADIQLSLFGAGLMSQPDSSACARVIFVAYWGSHHERFSLLLLLS